ncbi:MAG: hypothetical protein ABH873_09690 [Candidatus Firestonebacteria bacterium]
MKRKVIILVSIILSTMLFSFFGDNLNYKLIKEVKYSNISFNSQSKNKEQSSIKQYVENLSSDVKEIEISFNMKIYYIFQWDNIFQTAIENDGVRLELSLPSTLAIGIGNVKKNKTVFKIIEDDINYDEWYSVYIKIDRNKKLTVKLNNKTVIEKVEDVDYRISDIVIGTGFSKTRAFNGEVNNFIINYKLINKSKVISIVILFMKIVMTSVCLLLFYKYLPGDKLYFTDTLKQKNVVFKYNILKYLNFQNGIILHTIINYAVVFLIIKKIIIKVGLFNSKTILLKYNLNEWAIKVTNGLKPCELALYIISVFIIVISFILVFIFLKYYLLKVLTERIKNDVKNIVYFYLIVSTSLIYNMILYYILKNNILMNQVLIVKIAFMVVWLLLLLFPVFYLLWRINLKSNVSKNKLNNRIVIVINIIINIFYLITSRINYIFIFISKIYDNIQKKVIIIVITVVLSVIFIKLAIDLSPLYTGDLYIGNEYFSFSEKTKLKSGVVDNHEFINKNKIGSLFLHHSIIPDSISMKIPVNDLLKEFINKNSSVFYYNNNNKSLYINKRMNENEKNDLENVYFNNENTKHKISEFYELSQKYYEKSPYLKIKQEFVSKNIYELNTQSMVGYFFHHHSQIYLPILKYSHTKKIRDIDSQYGFLLVVFIMSIMKIINSSKTMFNDYFHVLNMFYLIYPILGILITSVIFKLKNVIYIFMSLFILITSIYMIGFESLNLSPGFNPARHLFDMFMIASLYLFYEKKYNIKYYVLSLFIAVISILWSKESGIMLYVSFLISIIFMVLFSDKYNKKMKILLTIITLIPSVIIFLNNKSNIIDTGIYMFLGVGCPKIVFPTTENILLVFAILGIIILYNLIKKERYSYFYMFLWLYGVMNMLYYIWNPAPNHLWNVIMCNFLTITLFIKLILDTTIKRTFPNKCILILLMIYFADQFYFPAINEYNKQLTKFNNIFKEHEKVLWNYEGIRFITTMQIEMIDKDIQLINKINDGSNGIYLLSKMDDFLPVILNKHNKLPVMSLMTNLVAKNDSEKIINYFKEKQPEYIVADKDIYLPSLFQIVDPEDKNIPLSQPSQIRSAVIDEFKKCARIILNKYTSIEDGYLLTVYRINNK